MQLLEDALLPGPAKMMVRKCLGKNKDMECIQGGDHPNTRWECAFETSNKEEFLKHCKNIQKRTKWREQGKSRLHSFSVHV